MVDDNGSDELLKDLLQGGVALLGGVSATAMLWAAKARYAQMQDMRKSVAWKDYRESADAGLASQFFQEDRLRLDLMFSWKLNGHPAGKALKAMEAALAKAVREGDPKAPAFLITLLILRDYEGIIEAVNICKKGPEAAVKRSCWIIQAKDYPVKDSREDTLLNAGADLYPSVQKMIDENN